MHDLLEINYFRGNLMNLFKLITYLILEENYKIFKNKETVYKDKIQSNLNKIKKLNYKYLPEIFNSYQEKLEDIIK